MNTTTRTIACLLAAGLLGPAMALAATFKVNVTLDEPDANPGDGICSYDPELEPPFFPVCTLRAAVMEGNATQAPDTVTILVKPGVTYQLSKFGRDENMSAKGDLDILRPMQIRVEGDGSEKATVDAMLNDRAFQFHPSANDSEMSGLEIIRGFIPDGDGAAILSHAENMHLELVDVHDTTRGTEIGSLPCAINGVTDILDSWIHHNGFTSADTRMNGICTNLRGLTIARSTVNNNGFYGINVQKGSLWLHTSTVSKNGMSGVFLLDSSGAIHNATIALNAPTLEHFAQLAFHTTTSNKETLQVVGSIVKQAPGNLACKVQEAVDSSATLYLSWNLYGDASCVGDGADDTSLSNADIQLYALADSGGPTPTHLPAEWSDAIDYAPAVACDEIDTDQRGVPRPVSYDGSDPARCDIGAVELESLTAPMGPVFSDDFEGM